MDVVWWVLLSTWLPPTLCTAAAMHDTTVAAALHRQPAAGDAAGRACRRQPSSDGAAEKRIGPDEPGEPRQCCLKAATRTWHRKATVPLLPPVSARALWPMPVHQIHACVTDMIMVPDYAPWCDFQLDVVFINHGASVFPSRPPLQVALLWPKSALTRLDGLHDLYSFCAKTPE